MNSRERDGAVGAVHEIDNCVGRAEHLGIVEAKDEAEAIKKAADMYDIPPERRNRITVRQVNRDV